jgi:metal-responsive CopG/Arc/MetJ family transcriptional regulator
VTSSRKVRAGVSFDESVASALDTHVRKLGELNVDRSEVVNAILDEYFEGNGSTESVWEAVSRRRTKRRK